MAGRRSVRRQVLVLDRTKLKEQDLILTMLSSDGEQVRAIARGARKPASRLAARTEIFCESDILVSEGRGLGIVTEAEVIDAHAMLRSSVETVAAASVICEIARLTSFEDVGDPYLYAIAQRALQSLERAVDRAHLDILLAGYVFKVLSHCGWMPVLDCCVACGESPATRFSVLSGGLLCESCARNVEGAEPIHEGYVLWLRALVSATFETLLHSEADTSTGSYLMTLAHLWAAAHLDARLRATEFYRSF